MPVRRRRTPFPVTEALLTVFLWLFVGAAASSAQPAVPVIVSEVSAMAFEDRVEALGTLRANESVQITASVTETVSALYFDDGERVEGGQLLVEMTSAEEQARLKEARAREREAATQFRRVQSLAKQGTASQALLDERSREWQTARAQLVAIESQLSDRVIKAPFPGVIGLRNISVGALVEPGDRIATLDDDSILKLDLAVPSVYLATLKPGLPVTATTPAYGDRVFDGELSSIDSRADPVTRSVIVRVLLPNEDRLLKPGLLMQVTLRKNPRTALVIPEAALMPMGREQYVFVAEPSDSGHKASKRKVAIGTRRPGLVEVLSGLQKGEQVVTHGTLRVRPGQLIAIKAIDDGQQPIDVLLSATPGDSGR